MRRRITVYEIAEVNPAFLVRWELAELTYKRTRAERLAAEKRRRMELARFNLRHLSS